MNKQEWFKHFDEKYAPLTVERAHTFRKALTLFNLFDGKIIVETGCVRDMSDEGIVFLCDRQWKGDGGSTIIFADYVSNFDGHLYSCDIEQVPAAESVTQEYKDFVTFHLGDSKEWLKTLDFQIDLLYLDSFDFNRHDPAPAQEHNLAEFKAAEDKLHSNSIVMIDDYSQPHFGKAGLTKDYLAERGWKVVLADKQVIYTR